MSLFAKANTPRAASVVAAPAPKLRRRAVAGPGRAPRAAGVNATPPPPMPAVAPTTTTIPAARRPARRRGTSPTPAARRPAPTPRPPRRCHRSRAFADAGRAPVCSFLPSISIRRYPSVGSCEEIFRRA
jgi:hypothetical protein